MPARKDVVAAVGAEVVEEDAVEVAVGREARRKKQPQPHRSSPATTGSVAPGSHLHT